MSKMLFSIYAEKFSGSADVMKEINMHLRGTLLDTQYITAFYAIYDSSDGRLTFTNAGHPRGLFYRESKGKVMALDTFGLFLGISDNIEYEEKSITVNRGDRLFLYTDGISELKDSSGEEFGEQRLGKFIRENHQIRGEDFNKSLLKTVNSFSKESVRNDDLAFLNIEF